MGQHRAKGDLMIRVFRRFNETEHIPYETIFFYCRGFLLIQKIASFIHSIPFHFIDLFVRSLVQSLSHCFIHALSHSLFHSRIHSWIHEFIHSFIQSFISFIYSFIHSFIRSLTHSPIHSFIHSFSQSVSHSLIHSLNRTLQLPFNHSIQSLMHLIPTTHSMRCACCRPSYGPLVSSNRYFCSETSHMKWWSSHIKCSHKDDMHAFHEVTKPLTTHNQIPGYI